jgi:hypothetical protein
MTSKNKIQLVVVVNGVETVVDANLNAPLRTVAQHALNASGNQGRPLADWELKDERGQLLDLDRAVSTFNFAANAVLYLTLSVGVNGVLQDRGGMPGLLAAKYGGCGHEVICSRHSI